MIATSRKADGRNLGIFGMMSYNIRTDPAYQGGNYKEQPRDGMRWLPRFKKARSLPHTYRLDLPR